MYALGQKPSTPNEAYDVLESVFGGNEFTGQDAADALADVLNMSEAAAKNELNSLYQIGAIEDV